MQRIASILLACLVFTSIAALASADPLGPERVKELTRALLGSDPAAAEAAGKELCGITDRADCEAFLALWPSPRSVSARLIRTTGT